MELLQDYFTYCHGVLWSETFWFPHNASWKDFQDMREGPHKDVTHPQVSSLYAAVLFAIALCLLRMLFESFVLNPLADVLGLKQMKMRKPESVPQLDQFFRSKRRPSHDDIDNLAKQIGWSTRRIERWFRVKRNYRKSTVRNKFCEAGWRFTFYLVAFFVGVYVLHDEEFAYDWSHTRAMDTWPHHHLKTEFWFYYVMEIGFYISLFVSLLTDVRRSDFVAMTVHHVLTIALLLFSWTINFVRIGLVILLLHDSSDYLLEATKMCIYVKKDKLANGMILVFTSVWMVTRMYMYPVHLVYPIWKEYYAWYLQFGHFPAVLCQVCFLSLLVVLNLIWTYYILMTIVGMFCKGDAKDERSDSEVSEVSSTGESVTDMQNGRNGHIKNKHD